MDHSADNTIFTIGHSTRTLTDLEALLRRHIMGLGNVAMSRRPKLVIGKSSAVADAPYVIPQK